MLLYRHYFSLLSLFLSLFNIAVAQADMTKGYAYLDNQQYPEAIKYFTEVLEQYPDNKTAKICLGRSLGLSGYESEALDIFMDLNERYAQDPEVMLNLAEAHMWTKDYQKALVRYNEILNKDSLNFTALLGRSNALTSLNLHQEAIDAIDLSDRLFPENPQIRISKKYIYLGRANELRSGYDFQKAHDYVDQVLVLFPNDKDALSLKAGIYLYQQKALKARSIYERLNRLYPKDSDILSGLGYTHLLVNNHKAYLKYAELALQESQSDDQNIDLNSQLNFVRALFLNNKKDLVNKRLDTLAHTYGDSIDFQLIYPQLSLWGQKFDQSRKQYRELFDKDSTRYDILVGNAEILNVFKERKQALDFAQKALGLQPNNPDILRMKEAIAQYNSLNISLSAQHSYDGGNNRADQWNATFSKALTEKSQTFFGTTYRKTKNTFFDNRGSNITLMAGNEWFIHPKVSFLVSAGLTQLRNESENIDKGHFVLASGIKVNPLRYHSFEFAYDKSYFDYNPDLISESIESQNYKMIYHYYGPQRIGFYNQLIRSIQSDDNKRWLYFGSLYYNVLMYPVIQTGFNINRFGYSIQIPQLYFSPSSFGSNEVFLKVDSEIVKGSKWQYFALAAAGWQSIESNSNQSTLRLEAKISYLLDTGLVLGLNYLYSNAAQSTISGFTYHQAGLSLSFKL